MPAWGAVKRRDLIAGLRALGFKGPFSGGTHEFMVRRDLLLTIPNPHRGEIGVALLALILRAHRRTGSRPERPPSLRRGAGIRLGLYKIRSPPGAGGRACGAIRAVLAGGRPHNILSTPRANTP